jgi:hypothetical protein
MKESAQIDVTYKSFWFSATYSYALSDVEDQVGFTYTAIEGLHPFAGGARVWLESTPQGTSQFHWQGEYVTPADAWMERRFFSNYSRRFFQQLEQRIARKEETLCAN